MAATYTKLPDLSAQIVNRFWSKVKILPSGCWEWQAAHVRYGSVWINHHCYLPHRVAYKIYYCVDPEELKVCHSCDNTICCNPFHLWLGTQRENCIDMSQKGRCGKAKGDNNGSRMHPEKLKRGEDVHTAVLSAEQVKEIRAKYRRRTYGLVKLALEYGVDHGTISAIILRKSWKHIV